MEQTKQNNGEPLEPQQAAAKAVLLAECDRLAAAGITFVAVHFDGYGDDGTTEELKCYSSDWYASGEHEPVKYDASHLQEHFEALVPFGYENDCGGFGDVMLDVSARKLTVSPPGKCPRHGDVRPGGGSLRGTLSIRRTSYESEDSLLLFRRISSRCSARV